MRFFYNKKFTLIEMLICLGILGLILIYLTSTFKNQVKIVNNVDDSNELRQSARIVLNKTIDLIKQYPNVKVYENAIVSVQEENEMIYIVDYSGTTQRGYLNLKNQTNYGIIIDKDNNEISNNIKTYSIESIGNNLIKITITTFSHKTKKEFSFSTIVNLNKIY